MKIVLMGNPNVGKSAIFSRLTGVSVICANYPGTTVEMRKGKLKIGGISAEVIDSPGTYSLEPINEAERVATRLVHEADQVIVVIDATNLERGLYLTLQIRNLGIPLVIALNIWDEAKHRGIQIDADKLSEMLGVPVIPTIATTGEGIKKLVNALPSLQVSPNKMTGEEIWIEIGRVIASTQQVTHRHHTFLEKLGDISMTPSTGIPLAMGILLLSFFMVWIIGETITGYALDPLFNLYEPVILKLSVVIENEYLEKILIGEVGETVQWEQAMGLLTTGLYVPFAIVMPFVFAFYLLLSLLEDSGYLPRLSVLADSLMHRVGLHGLAVLPMFIGLGCHVPGILATRTLENRKQKFIAAAILSTCIPCMAQLSVISSLIFNSVGRDNFSYAVLSLLLVFLILFLVWLFLGNVLNRVIKGGSPEIFMEVPPYRIPYLPALTKKMWMRIRAFLFEAIPFIFLGIAIANILDAFGIVDVLGTAMSPLLSAWLGLPEGAANALLLGILRKDVAVGMLYGLNLSLGQAIVACIVLTMYFPCIATFVILFEELGFKSLVATISIMLSTALLVGGLLNLILI
jgi:ferrous iron transport protein B